MWLSVFSSTHDRMSSLLSATHHYAVLLCEWSLSLGWRKSVMTNSWWRATQQYGTSSIKHWAASWLHIKIQSFNSSDSQGERAQKMRLQGDLTCVSTVYQNIWQCHAQQVILSWIIHTWQCANNAPSATQLLLRCVLKLCQCFWVVFIPRYCLWQTWHFWSIYLWPSLFFASVQN